jgi:hypothetical protein
MQKPRLCDTRHNVHTYRLDNDLAKEVSLGFGIPVLGREARLEDNVNRRTNVDLVYPSVARHADVLLLSMEQHGV